MAPGNIRSGAVDTGSATSSAVTAMGNAGAGRGRWLKGHALPGRGLGDDDVDNDMARVAEEARGLLELLHEEQDEYAMHRRVFGEHDVDKDTKLSKEEALEMLKKMGTDVSNLPADWFEKLDTNGNGYIDPEEYDEDMAKTLK